MFWKRKKDKIELIENIQKFEISDNDIIVVHASIPLSKENCMDLQKKIEGALLNYGFKIKVLFFEGDLHIVNILSKKETKDLLNDNKEK